MSFEGKKIIVVGGAGFVGGNLVRHLDQAGARQIIAIDNLLSAEKENVITSNRVELRIGSIADDSILNMIEDDVDYIFHLSTFHGNQSSIANPLVDHENNTLTTLKLLEHVKDFKNLKKLVYSSAGCSVAQKTFDTATATAEVEMTNIKHDSPYSISKIVGEFYCVYYYHQHQVPTVRARFQNVYGPGEVLGAGRWRGTPATVWRNVTPTFIFKAIKGIPISLENGGIASRDFIYVDDICRGLMACALKGTAGDTYNLASGVETTIKELADKILQLTNSNSEIDQLPKRPWDNSGKRFGSTEKSAHQLDFKCQINLEEGLSRTIEWTKNNMPFIEQNMQKHAPKLGGKIY
ncbi:MAG TPA: NAD-dependent epimerase/dehydratase family protein [Saprospiraceae bacterium]|nr:NAD-dependent epimerase/dehydratase family protein [Saprospiraceae bacterium]